MGVDRDRLIHLIANADTYDRYDCELCTKDDNACRNCYAERLADYLLSSGVIVPPCKVGSTIYLPCLNDWGDIENYTITEFVLDNDGLCFVVDDEDREAHSIETIGKEVFLTKEEAEQALKERGNDDR